MSFEYGNTSDSHSDSGTVLDLDLVSTGTVAQDPTCTVLYLDLEYSRDPYAIILTDVIDPGVMGED